MKTGVHRDGFILTDKSLEPPFCISLFLSERVGQNNSKDVACVALKLVSVAWTAIFRFNKYPTKTSKTVACLKHRKQYPTIMGVVLVPL